MNSVLPPLKCLDGEGEIYCILHKYVEYEDGDKASHCGYYLPGVSIGYTHSDRHELSWHAAHEMNFHIEK